jgi:outer membrane protein OmpA-like peptidoglycan-associated protein
VLGSEHNPVSTLKNRDTQNRNLPGEAEEEPAPLNGALGTEEKAEKSVESIGKRRSVRKCIRYALFSLIFVCVLGTGYFLITGSLLRKGPILEKGSILGKGTVFSKGLSAPHDRNPGAERATEPVRSGDGFAFETVHLENREASYLVNFLPDSSIIRSGERAKLIKVADFIERNPPDRVTITGHTAPFGTEESCLILSIVRAEAVRDFLLASSPFDEARITARGVGASQPINTIPSKMAENRRAEIHLGY